MDKLEGLGARTKMNLSNVRACVGHIDARAVATVPQNAPNKIVTGSMPHKWLVAMVWPDVCVMPDMCM